MDIELIKCRLLSKVKEPDTFGHSLVQMPNDVLLLYGGCKRTEQLESVDESLKIVTIKKSYSNCYRYLEETDEWYSLVGDDLPPVHCHSAVRVAGDYMMVFGGYCDQSMPLCDIYLLKLDDINVRCFKMLPEYRMAPPRAYHSAVIMSGTV
jgi:hypothetical protein